jgi:hypothetical protein
MAQRVEAAARDERVQGTLGALDLDVVRLLCRGQTAGETLAWHTRFVAQPHRGDVVGFDARPAAAAELRLDRRNRA